MPETFNEQLVLHDWEHDVCTRAYPFLAALGAIRLQDEVERVGRDAGLPHEWKLGWKHHGDKRHRTRITFEGIDYSDGKSKDGTAKIFDLPSEGLGWSRTYNAKAIPVDEEINEEIELHEENSEDLNANFNVTNRTSIKADAKGGVDGIGEVSTSFESETTASVGGGWGRASASSRTIAHKIKTAVHVPVGEKVLVSVDVVKRKTVTPVTEDGYIEATGYINLYDWAEENAPYLRDGKDQKHNVIKFDSIQDLLWFIEGQRVAEYPNMRHFLAAMRGGRTPKRGVQ